MPGVTVIKRNITGEETWRYSGQVLKKKNNALILEALFNLDDTPFMGTFLKRGDRFVEIFFSDHWYNIFEIHDRDDDSLKGWYCNIARPAVFETEDRLSFVDLALDLWIAPEGAQTVLDEDEFENLNLDGETKEKALAALDQLKKMFLSSSPSSIFL
jgi:protein associated with RNAse G/E